MVYYHINMQQYFQNWGCGILHGTTSILSSYSFDTVKVHMQSGSNQGMLKTISNIIRNQGILHLYSGIYYPLMTFPIVQAFVFSTYQLYKTLRQKNELSYLDGFENGAFAGFIITFIVTPVDLIKSKMQMNVDKQFKNSRECLRHVFRTEGIAGIYKGAIPTGLRQIPSYGFQFATYEFLKGYFIGKQKQHLSIYQALCVGPLAALCSELFTYPQDVLKTRIQVSKKGQYVRHKHIYDQGVIDCAKKLLKVQGYRGFINGLKPCLLKAVTGDGIGIVVYQKCQQGLAKLKRY